MPKATKAEKEQRVNAIYTMIVNGATRYEILQYAAKAWKLKTRQTDDYIAAAYALIAIEAEYYRAREIGKAHRRLDLIYGQAFRDKDYNAAIRAQAELNKLYSLYEPEPPKVLKIMGMTEAELQVVGQELRRAGLKPSDVFEAMLNELAAAEEESDENP